MNFGEWVRDLRKAQKLDIRTLAGQIGVEASTISRVENTRTQVTLSTAIRICEGLDVTSIDLLNAVQGKHNSYQEKKDSADKAIPTVEDVETFLLSLLDNPSLGYQILSDLLNQVVLLRDADTEVLPKNYPGVFNPEDLHRLLFLSPIYQLEVQYPSDIRPEDILSIYERNGALTLVDIGMYLKKLRREKQITLAHLEGMAKISTNVLSRLEIGSLEQIRLADILNIDEQLEQEGILLQMYWRAYRLNELLYRMRIKKTDRPSSLASDQYEKLAHTFIILHRWLRQLLTSGQSAS
jgi:transcriptional regulator with XRE-family HTH domain